MMENFLSSYKKLMAISEEEANIKIENFIKEIKNELSRKQEVFR